MVCVVSSRWKANVGLFDGSLRSTSGSKFNKEVRSVKTI